MAARKAATRDASAAQTSAARTPRANKSAGEAPTPKRAKKSAAKSPAATKSVAKKTAAPVAKKTAAKKSAPSASKKATAKAADRYTDPALRERIKAKVLREDKGGRPGQWSARKAQMVAHEYEAAGGKFKGGPDPSQQNLAAWGDEHWTTSDGEPARRKDGMHRYLPEKAWEELTPAQKRATERKKLAGDKQGAQFVANTGAAVKARRHAEKG